MPRNVSALFLPLLLFCSQSVLLHAAPVTVATHPGQAITLLTDGHVLVTGGTDLSGHAIGDAYLIDTLGQVEKLAHSLNKARSWHTVTALPDGTVLIYGGTGEHGSYVRTMELYNPASQTFLEWKGPGLVPRASHTATVLSDGRVVIIGGTSEGSSFPEDIQLWDFRTGKIETVHASPLFPRKGHSALLLSDGRVTISGGINPSGAAVKPVEVFDEASQSFSVLQLPAEDNGGARLRIVSSSPSDGSQDFPIQDYLSLRFSKLIDVRGVTGNNIVLRGPGGAVVPIAVASAEQGRLAFIIPTTSLAPGATYSLFVHNIRDDPEGDILPDTTISFQTAGVSDNGNDDQWIPDAAALAGNGGSRTGPSRWEKLPALKAAQGVTALAGQVLGISGHPLPNVTLQIESQTVKSDDTGRFLLSDISPGHHILVIDGRTTTKQHAVYGLFEAGVDIISGQTNVLNYTIWMTRLDTAHVVHIPSPTIAPDTVITTPALPGLELHLPANTVIVDREGKSVTELTITPVPLDKPPFPLPTGVRVPIYFTIQPGGAEIRVQGGAPSMKGARLYYPNTYNEPSGTIYNFWNYDAASKGWYVYGKGYVTADKHNIIPDPGVLVYELTGAMVGGGGAKPAVGRSPGPKNHAGDPVDLSSGQFIYEKTDLAVADVLSLALKRTYITNDHYVRSFGIGCSNNYDIFMVGDANPYTYQELIEADGSSVRFNRTSSGTGFSDAVYKSTSPEGPWYGATISWSPGTMSGASWIMRRRDGLLYGFPEAAGKDDQVHQALVGVQDRYGNTVSLTRDPGANLTTMTSQNGRFISLSRDPQNRITQATDNTGRTVSYSYDSAGHVATVTDVTGGITTFTYNPNDQIVTIKDPKGIVYLTNQYDSFGRVVLQTEGDGGTYQFNWTPSSNVVQVWTASRATIDRYNPSDYEGYTGLISAVDVTDPRGYVRHVTYNNLGMKVWDVRAFNQPEQQATTYQYYADDLLKSTTDGLARTTTFDYDALGNATSVTYLSGTSSSATYSATYDPTYSQVLSTTDPLAHSSTFTYDSLGTLTSMQDPLGNGSAFTYDNHGRVAKAADALGNATTFSYVGGDLTGIRDPTGNTTTIFPDQLGRQLAVIDAMGHSSRVQYDNAGHIVSKINAQGNTASFTYDPNGNLVSVQDYLAHTTKYTYDVADRQLTRTDPLQRTVTNTYDVGGNLVSSTDAKGLVTTRTLDGLGRPVYTSYGVVTAGNNATYESRLTYQFDAANRLTSIADTSAGTITHNFDGLDRLIGETSPQGSIGYTYDVAGRRSTAQSLGGPLTQYTYDSANRLTGISQGTAQVAFAYDLVNRRSTLTLPNGVLVQYAYDQDSRVQSISYGPSGTSIGTLGFVYDAAGNQVEKNGTLAGTSLPVALGSVGYNAANELISADGATYAYDANGNMTAGLGGAQLTWNARNQLSAITGFMNSSFSYDALGRRIAKTVGAGQPTSFQYDGVNRIIETTVTGTATILPGSTDEFFMRSDSAGVAVPLTDALGSTVGLTDASGNLVTNYIYEPYGTTGLTGANSNNSTQYTGRENDGTGLYYYRARYYDPRMARFVSSDPLGFGGGDLNLYRYVGNNPVSFVDPSGMDKSGNGGPGNGGPGNDGPGGGGSADDGSPDNPPASAPRKGVSVCGGGVFGVVGRELSGAVIHGAVGVITEVDSRSGISSGALVEAGVGDGYVAGGGAIRGTAGVEGFGYAGVNGDIGVAGVSAGIVGFSSGGVGVYADGQFAGRMIGGGAYINLANSSSCPGHP